MVRYPAWARDDDTKIETTGEGEGVKRPDKRNGLTESGVKDSFKKKLVRNRLTWAGHMDRLGD